MSYRRVYINTAEAIRTADVSAEDKSKVADAVAAALTEGEGAPDFDADRFKAHATSETDEKWAYNRATGGFVPAQAEGADDSEEAVDA